MSSYVAPDWSVWQPSEVATLIFVIRDDEVFLMRKKRGLGAGMITAPGGRVEGTETLAQCACRELDEEMGLQAGQLDWAGQIKFEFTDGYRLQVHVFKTFDAVGDAVESEEGIPLWTKWDQIPYKEMWADDPLWIPHLKANQLFSGQFVFEKEQLLGGEVELLEKIPGNLMEQELGIRD